MPSPHCLSIWLRRTIPLIPIHKKTLAAHQEAARAMSLARGAGNQLCLTCRPSLAVPNPTGTCTTRDPVESFKIEGHHRATLSAQPNDRRKSELCCFNTIRSRLARFSSKLQAERETAETPLGVINLPKRWLRKKLEILGSRDSSLNNPSLG